LGVRVSLPLPNLIKYYINTFEVNFSDEVPMP
jgi:hypothetical protein